MSRRHFILAPLTALLGLAAITLSHTASALDWPHWRGPNHNGISGETGWFGEWPGGTPARLWKASVGTGYSSVSVADGRVFTMGNQDDQDTVYCFQADTGEMLWKHSYAEPLNPLYYEGGPSSTPTVDGPFVYTLSRQGQLFCFQAKDGTIVWQKNIAQEQGLTKPKDQIPEWGFASSPLVEGQRLILNVGTTGIALNKSTGQVLWSSGKTAAGYSTPVPFDFQGKRYVTFFTAQHIVAVDVTNGRTLWKYPWKTRYDVNASDPVVLGTSVFVSSGYGHGCALLNFSGGTIRKVWENKNMKNQLNSSVLINGYLYGIDGDGGSKEANLRCLSFDKGEVQWSERSIGSGAVMAAEGKLIALSENGELVIAPATPSGFNPIARAQVIGRKCWTVPVLANGKVYCRNARGDLVCVDTTGKKSTSR